jgi:hypothetical protein
MRLPSQLLALSLLAGGCATADEWSKTYTVSANPEIRVETDDSSVTVRAWDEQKIAARVTTSGWKLGPGEVTVQESQTGSLVRLVVREPHHQFGINLGNRWIRVELQVPRHIASDIRTGDGNIQIEDIEGDTRLHTGDGRIEADSMRGALRAETGDGHIRIRGRLDRLTAHSGDGAIDADLLDGSRMSAPWSIETADGRITVRLARNFAANLDAHTGDGHISVEVPMAASSGGREHHDVRGAINGGGLTFSIRTSDGGIRVGLL